MQSHLLIRKQTLLRNLGSKKFPQGRNQKNTGSACPSTMAIVLSNCQYETQNLGTLLLSWATLQTGIEGNLFMFEINLTHDVKRRVGEKKVKVKLYKHSKDSFERFYLRDFVSSVPIWQRVHSLWLYNMAHLFWYHESIFLSICVTNFQNDSCNISTTSLLSRK